SSSWFPPDWFWPRGFGYCLYTQVRPANWLKKEFFFSGTASDNCGSPSANFARLSVPPSGLSVWRMESEAPTITQLLVEWSHGNQQALDRLTPLVYDELRRMARTYLRLERPDHTLQATALVHEAYLRLIDQHSVSWQN